MGSKGVRKGARLDTRTVVAHTARFVVVVAIIVFVAILNTTSNDFLYLY